MRVLRATRASIAAATIAATTFATASSITATLTLGAAPAYAGPDDNRSVETKAHIDAPKVFWNKQAGTFAINSQANGKTVPLETTANWVGRGYNDDGSQNYTFPITSDPRLDFLGKDGQLLYMAPQVPGPGNSPIWSGFGADTAVPIEQFQDGNFALEMVGFNGPGQMNMFNYSTYGSLPVTRLFSSHDKVSRTVWLDPGTHTHNITTFTKPGRYEVTFDATARTTDGSFITSKPTTLVWRVGGTNPADEKLGDVRAAYNKAADAVEGAAVEGAAAEGAADGAEASKPTFTIAPHAGSERDGDKNLTDLTFNAGSKDAEGTVVFYIDGYHLAEVPVKNGNATWSEMIGSQTSNFQAVFVPTKGAARWISAPLSATTGQKAVSTQDAGEFPEETPDAPAGEFSKGEVTVGSREVSVTARPQDKGDLINIDTKPADDSLIYNVTGGFYEEGYDEPTCPVEGVSGPGRRTIVADSEYCKGEGYSLRLTLEPQPRAAIGNTDVIDLGQVSGKGKTVETQFSGVGEGNAPEPSEPAPGDPEPNPGDGGDDGNEGSDGAVLDTPVTINNGHVDLRAMEVDGKFSVALGDDSRQHAKESVLRTINSTTLEVTKLAKVKREGNVLADESYDVLGPKGSELYVLPQGQQPGRVWPGFSSEALDRVKYPEGATMTLTPVSAPEGGKWFAYTENLGAINRMYASSDKASDVPLPPGTHMHTAWAFTKPGTYTIDVTARAKQAGDGEQRARARSAAANNDGGEATAETQRLTFVVEKKSAAEEPGDSAPPVEEPTEEPTEQPTEEPSEQPTPGEPGDEPTEQPGDNVTPEAPTDHPTEGMAPGQPADPTQPGGTDNAGAIDNAGTPSEAGGTDNATTPSDAATPSDAGGALARTGAEVVPAALAAVTVVAGMALLLVMRRRRA
ncbi:choice-of-anchor M domain-containing protein [Pseudoglutamicibacter cumminsii]|uniref:Choice-of-anchor M domain-containing protein n=1 Tax=Pseudoglutamicibacter cumminsii TaxID=156979 RepID=A0AAP4FGN0_9MICC|nr:choice-of-anchor M domain-containing protein [Pseudoglutamicibacter cumminsii]MDK6275097.1 choice-of-anchor M domain-containing protein [Pseudoglutamicibacter cumminsii]